MQPATAFALPLSLPATRTSPCVAKCSCARSPKATAAAAAAAQPPNPPPTPEWRQYQSCELLLPPAPTCLIQFTGGFGAGMQPRLYSALLSAICSQANAAVLAAPLTLTADHLTLSQTLRSDFASASQALQSDLGYDVPMFGLSHSLGGKLRMLMHCGTQDKVKANIYMAFNNSSIREAVPQQVGNAANNVMQRGKQAIDRAQVFLEDMGIAGPPAAFERATELLDGIKKGWEGEFRPDVQTSWKLAGEEYNVRDNLLIRFSRDSICQTEELENVLRERFGKWVVSRLVGGSHVTPLTPVFENEVTEGVAAGVAEAVIRELEDCVSIIVAYIKLQVEVLG